MSEPHRADTPPEGSPIDDRDSRIEQLLLAGLDQYFSGRYEQAIDIWTRVAFLERKHGRARAYIERARGALAERQRKTEELVDRGRIAFDQGDADQARNLLSEAVASGSGGDTARLLLERLDRVAPARDAGAAAYAAPARVSRGAGGRRREWVVTGLASLAVAVAVLAAGRMVSATLAAWPDAVALAPEHQDPLPAVGGGELMVQRARARHAEGRVTEALGLLESVGASDPARARADELRAAWQQQILDEVDAPSAPDDGSRR